MLYALIAKDVMLLRHRLLFALAGLALAIAAADQRPAMIFGVIIVQVVVTVSVSQIGVIEEKSRGDVLLQILPVSRRQIVASRYLLVLLLAVAAAGVFTAGMAARGFLPEPLSARLAGAAVYPVMPIGFWALALPLVFRFGMTRSQSAIGILSFLLPVAATTLPHSARLPLRSFLLQPSAPLAWTALGTAVALALVSFTVATWLYERRDL
jgi:hypothetical protein